MEENGGRLDIVYKGDTSGLDKATKDASKSFDEVADSAEKASGRIDSAFAHTSSISDMTLQSKELKAAIKANSDEIKEMQSELNELQKSQKGVTGEKYFKIKYDIKDLEAKIKATKEDTRAMQDEKNTLDRLIAEQKNAEAAMRSASQEAERQGGVFVKLLGGQERYNAILEAMPAPLKSAASGIASMTKAALAFIATPLGAIISAVVLGLKALHTWFKSSAEGQMALIKSTGYLSGVMGQLKEVVIKVGEWIYKAFNDPKEAVKDLWESIKTNLLNRMEGIINSFKALGKITSSALDLDWEGVKNGAKEYADAMLQTATGVENVIDKTKEFVLSVNEAAKKTSDLRIREEQLARDRKKWAVEETELRAKADEAYQRSLYGKTDKERSDALKEYKDIINKIYQKKIAFQEEEVRIQEELNALTTNSQEDNDALLDKQAELNRLKSEQIRAQRTADTALGGIGRKSENSSEEYAKKELEIEEAINKTKIDKERALITDKEELREFDHKQEIARLEKEKNKAEAAGLNIAKYEELIKLKKELYEIETESAKQEEEKNKRLKEQRELENQILTIQDKYRTAEDKIAEIRAKAAKMRAQKPGSSAAIDQWERDEISKVNLGALQDTQSEYYTVLFGKLEKYSVGAINKAIESAEKAIEAYTQKAKSENRALTVDELKAIEMLMDAMKKAGQHTEYIAANGLKGIASGLKEAAGLAALFSENLGDAIGNISAIIDGVGDIKGGISDMKTAIADMKEKQGSGEKMGFADILGSIGALAGGAGVILGGITKAFSAIDSLFGWSKAEAEHQKALKELQEARLKLQREYNNALAEQNLLYKEAESIFGTKQISKAINSFRVYKEQLEQFKEELKGNSPDQKNFVQSILGLPDRRGFREQMDLYRQGLGALGEIEVVTGSKKVRSGFLGLGRKQVDVYSSLIKAYPEITKGANGFNKALAEQILATQKMSDADKERLQQLIDLSDNYEKAKDALDDYLQSTFGSLGDSILDAIVSQVEKGTDAVEEFGKAAGDVVKKLGQQIAYELFFSDMFEKLQDDLSNVYQATDNPEEIARKQQALIEKFYQGIEGNIKEATDFYKQWTDQQDKIFGTGQQQGSASAKAIQTITQDQANSLDGKITGLQETTYGILDCSTVIRDNVSVVRSEVSFIRQSMDDLNLFSKKQLEHLAGIERNTSPLPQMAQTLKSIETNTSKL